MYTKFVYPDPRLETAEESEEVEADLAEAGRESSGEELQHHRGIPAVRN